MRWPLWRRGTLCGLDLGSSRTRLALAGQGLLIDQPSVVARRPLQGKQMDYRAAGAMACILAERLPEGWSLVWPIRAGHLVDGEAGTFLIRRLLEDHGLSKRWWPTVAVVAVFADAPPVQRQLLAEVLGRTGVRSVHYVAQSLAAALGADVPVHSSRALLVVHVGAHRTEVAVLALGMVLNAETFVMGGDDFSRAIQQHFFEVHRLRLGPGVANELKHGLTRWVPSRADPSGDRTSGPLPDLEVCGADVATGLPTRVRVRPVDLLDTLRIPCLQIAKQVRNLLERCNPQIAAEVMDSGIVLTGGSAVVPGLAEAIEELTGLTVTVAADPARSVIRGLEWCANHPELWNRRVAVETA
jgi:rod shape-determining protein MreB